MIDLNEIAKKIHTNAIDKGFYERMRTFEELAALALIDEGGEVIAADRCGLSIFNSPVPGTNYFEECLRMEDASRVCDLEIFRRFVKDTVECELIDMLIRFLDMAAFYGVDLRHVKQSKTIDELYGRGANEMYSGVHEFLYAMLRKWMRTERFEGKSFVIRGAIGILIAYLNQGGIPWQKLLSWKMEYNEGRERLHGKRYWYGFTI